MAFCQADGPMLLRFWAARFGQESPPVRQSAGGTLARRPPAVRLGPEGRFGKTAQELQSQESEFIGYAGFWGLRNHIYVCDGLKWSNEGWHALQ